MKPLGDRVAMKPVAAKEQTDSGILLAPQAVEAPSEADVVAVGPDVRTVAVGQRVFYPKYAGMEVTLDDRTVLVLKEREIVGLVEEEVAQRPEITMEDGSPIPVGAKRLTAKGWQQHGENGWVSITDPAYQTFSSGMALAEHAGA